MHLDLTDEHADAVRAVLRDAIGDLSHEIADTDNPSFRSQLRARRQQLEEVLRLLDS